MAGATISFSIKDGLGTTATALFYANVDDAATVADLDTEVTALAALVDGLIDGQIVASHLSINGGPVGGAPASASRVEQGLLVDFRNATTGRLWGAWVPALADAHITGGRPTPGPVDALATHMIAGAATVHYTTSQGDDLGAVASAIISFRKRRRQLDKTSFEILP